MFKGANSFTLNSCTLNEVTGPQENHFSTTNDSRTNCDNQTTHHTSNSHNNYMYEDDEFGADQLSLGEERRPIPPYNSPQEHDLNEDDYLVPFNPAGGMYGSSLSLAEIPNTEPLRLPPPSVIYATGPQRVIESVSIPIYDSPEAVSIHQVLSEGSTSTRRSPSPLRSLLGKMKMGRKTRD